MILYSDRTYIDCDLCGEPCEADYSHDSQFAGHEALYGISCPCDGYLMAYFTAELLYSGTTPR